VSSGGPLIAANGNSLAMAVMRNYTEHKWEFWRFSVVPVGMWDQQTNQRRFFEWLGGQLGIHSMEDWYSIRASDTYKYGGTPPPPLVLSSFLVTNTTPTQSSFISSHSKTKHIAPAKSLLSNQFNSSLKLALRSIYVDHPWDDWRFGTVPTAFWKTPQNVRRYLEYAATILRPLFTGDGRKVGGEDEDEGDFGQDMSFWYNVSVDKLPRPGSTSTILSFLSLCCTVVSD
jgi:hypothetical protein